MDEMTMDDFKKDIDRSFTPLKEGDVIKCIVTGVSDEEVSVDLNYYIGGIIPLEECSNEPGYVIKEEIQSGQELTAMVLEPENDNGHVLLSLIQERELHIWDELKSDMESHTIFTLKVVDAVKGGIIVYVKGIKGFIPASKIALEYIEDTTVWFGKTINAVIIDVKQDEQRLVLSSKALLQEKAVAEKTKNIENLIPGTILSGTIERIESYGVFVNIGEDLTGLVHISQITDHFIKSPKEVVQIGDTVTVKILSIEGDRISLSMKAAAERNPEEQEDENESLDYHDHDEPSGYMESLLKNISLGKDDESK
ncbi:MAG: S1 RNA-binding domain-containing protein [Lachnoclostridium sp.]|jgi:small subunit ribosomal protein S1|nr:S1 RNA-binding domain-containing protein [Lachnoclostridium sp.]